MKTKTRRRRRKVPVTSPSLSLSSKGKGKGSGGIGGGGGFERGSASPRSSARVIRRFHVLLKRKAQLERTRTATGRSGVDESERGELESKLREVEDEMQEMGGLEVYQRMSRIGQGKDRGGGSEGVFIGWMKELALREVVREKGRGKMKLLEVGALKPDNYASCSSWIDVLPIDLRSTHPGIVERDFLEMQKDDDDDDDGETCGVWDAISLSLVVNFVPEPRERGRRSLRSARFCRTNHAFMHFFLLIPLFLVLLMFIFILTRCHHTLPLGRMLRVAYEMLRQDGLLFLALPLPCVSNSRYLTFEHLTKLMEYIGFTKVRERWKEGGKMGYWLFRKECSCPRDGSGETGTGDVRGKPEGEGVRYDKKDVLREGKRCNNFCILL